MFIYLFIFSFLSVFLSISFGFLSFPFNIFLSLSFRSLLFLFIISFPFLSFLLLHFLSFPSIFSVSSYITFPFFHSSSISYPIFFPIVSLLVSSFYFCCFLFHIFPPCFSFSTHLALAFLLPFPLYIFFSLSLLSLPLSVLVSLQRSIMSSISSPTVFTTIITSLFLSHFPFFHPPALPFFLPSPPLPNHRFPQSGLYIHYQGREVSQKCSIKSSRRVANSS